MDSKEIRASFLNFFKSKGCTVVASSSLIPQADPTLLFTSAGMVQFKANFLGLDKSLHRAVTCQKCVRTTDIDSVGFTNRHLTFFEMLGNFSFGDYFKEQAINWAWEYLTQTLQIPAEKLYVSIYKGGIAERDNEAYNFWLKHLPKEKIFELGEKDNFWTMGPTGPCGPCSEIYYDFGDKGCKNKNCNIECDCGRFVEIWNIVFTQFDRKDDGSIVPLSQKNIDTGMGLERLVMAMQNVQSPFETDLFTPTINEAKKLLKIEGKIKEEISTLRIVSDHIRSSVFLISEGILPSNEGRGYILRRLIRRALRYGKLAGVKGPFLHLLVSVIDLHFGEIYPEIRNNKNYISSVIKTEEEAFFKTLENGEERLEDIIKKSKKTISGENAFYLYETFGFPVELTKEIALAKGLALDEESFEKAKKEAREKSRSYADEFSKEKLVVLQKIENSLKNTFVGYEQIQTKSKVLIVLNDKFEQVKELSGPGYAVLDKTPFYATGGGQMGDRGAFSWKDGQALVSTAEKPLSNIILHAVEVSGVLKEGSEIEVKIDPVNRKKTAANHTAVHLINEALRQVIGESVHQAGSFVSADVFRFDYTAPHAPTSEQLARVFEMANNAVIRAHPVNCEIRPLEDAKKLGAVTLVGEQYADPARFVMVGANFNEPSLKYSLELCGGTHVNNTSEIITVILIKEGALSAGVRRIEGVAGIAAIDYLKENTHALSAMAKTLETSLKEVPARVNSVLEDLKAAKKEIASLRQKLLTGGSGGTQVKEDVLNGKKIISMKAEGANPKELRTLADSLSQKHKDAVIVIAVDNGDRRSFVVKKAEGSNTDACTLAKGLAGKMEGSAGGKADFAQGGCKVTDWNEFLKTIKELL
ncbi:Alanyl-tRNA synthetase [Elusimicrobium minutum Pei191]|uniref:Alanine--tRNA ligase n=1 Tax=Elusimicrobium minutum (strain Pei191) TaxID=445932 RepID=SYA_ELUMP|nr:alanine--tRNA ligase [Elusimicrobium minutum]B2KAQ0.1 RecName: Full=Alanine--tRNA ligase; AltName: Full=Alanyl-tRNA synthetase; Short=AlaRS [Elusimicrobium minutum Pei191]ACC97596.1 Alanyl-tRNA synthetase [Elusimicrobium minutum Pei191]